MLCVARTLLGMTTTELVLSRVSDPALRALLREEWKAGDALDAYMDGAVHGQSEYAVRSRYEKARSARITYQSAR